MSGRRELRVCPNCQAEVIAGPDELDSPVQCSACATIVRPSPEGDTEPVPVGDGGRPAIELSSTSQGRQPGDHIGQTFAGCKIESLIGAGSMGAVYKAWQETLEIFVAVKTILAPQFGDSGMVQRFTKEARITARFTSPHVIKVKETGCQDGTHFLIMEYVEGKNLLQYVKDQPEGRLPPEQALDYLRQAALGLSEAERLNVVHRDIKPENLLLDLREGAPVPIKIADFGIVKDLSAGVGDTMSQGFTPGTPRYMSPEQINVRPLDHRSDMFSLGATFSYLITGKHPTEETSVEEVVAFKMKTPCLSPMRILETADIPVGLNTIIENMTSFDREDRYASFEDVIEDIDRARGGESVACKKHSVPGSKRKLAAAMASLALLVVLGWVLLNWPDEPPFRPEPGLRIAFVQLQQEIGSLLDSTGDQPIAKFLSTIQVMEKLEDVQVRITGDIDLLGSNERPMTELVEYRTAHRLAEEELRDRAQWYRDYSNASTEFGARSASVTELRRDLDNLESEIGTNFSELDKLIESLRTTIGEKLEETDRLLSFLEDELVRVGASGSLREQVNSLREDAGSFLDDPRENQLNDLSANVTYGSVIKGRLENEGGVSDVTVPFENLNSLYDSVERILTVSSGEYELVAQWATSEWSAWKVELRNASISTWRKEWDALKEQADSKNKEEWDDELSESLGQLSVAQGILEGIWPTEIDSELGQAGQVVESRHAVVSDALTEPDPTEQEAEPETTPSVEPLFPPDWPDEARQSWPEGYAVPLGLHPSSVPGEFSWDPERMFVLVATADEPFLVDKNVISEIQFEAYLRQTGTIVIPKPYDLPPSSSPVTEIKPSWAYEFSRRALEELPMTLPTQAELDLAEDRIVSPISPLKEMVRPPDSPSDANSVFVEGTAVREIFVDASTGFRCCFHLQLR